jgi:hypothetical protein
VAFPNAQCGIDLINRYAVNPTSSGSKRLAIRKKSHMKNMSIFIVTMSLFLTTQLFAAERLDRWSARDAQYWYSRQPWPVGSNYIPATAVNSIEMWQADTFDAATVDQELGWAEGIGMNVMRVFLHHLVWEQDPEGFRMRLSQFLAIADKHKLRIIPVLFDSCFDPDPHTGPQPNPVQGVNITSWVQGPGRERLEDESRWNELEKYVSDIVGTFGHDKRVLAWDLWNEPTPSDQLLSQSQMSQSPRERHYAERESKRKSLLTERLLRKVFSWARNQHPTQPLTSAIFDPTHEWDQQHLTAVERIQIDQSDVISFHSYSLPHDFEHQVASLRQYNRPLLCTEFMSRVAGSTIQGILPLGKRLDVGMFNWGLVDGRTQTRFPYDSWERPYTDHEPKVWNHDLLRRDGKPYRAKEIELIRALSSLPRGVTSDVVSAARSQ